MAENNPGKATTTNLSSIADYSVSSEALDFASVDGNTFVDFPKAAERYGYYKKFPQLKQAVDALAMWTAGRGWTASTEDTPKLEKIEGWGEDTLDSILENLIINKKIQGDAFAEIIRNDNGTLVNLKPISPERVRIVVGKNGRIKRYQYKGTSGSYRDIPRNKMFHLCNNRIGDEIHGTNIIDSVEWALKAREECMEIYQKIFKRSLVMGILYIDSNDTQKIQTVMTNYKTAVERGEMVVLPMGTAEVKDATVNVQDFLSWIQYLENFIYQALGVPKIIMGGSPEYTEQGGKMGVWTFEQVYLSEQRKLEQDFWNQLAIRIKFKKPNSLKDEVSQTEEANTGELNIQPNDVTATTNRE